MFLRFFKGEIKENDGFLDKTLSLKLESKMDGKGEKRNLSPSFF